MLIQNMYAFLVSKFAEFQHEEERLDSRAISNYSNNQKLHNDHHIGIYQSEGYGFDSRQGLKRFSEVINFTD